MLEILLNKVCVNFLFVRYICIYITQNLITIKLLFLFAGCPSNCIPKTLL